MRRRCQLQPNGTPVRGKAAWQRKRGEARRIERTGKTQEAGAKLFTVVEYVVFDAGCGCGCRRHREHVNAAKRLSESANDPPTSAKRGKVVARR
jgi:hypothetical protein